MARKKQIERDDSWMYIILLSTLVILGESLKTYTMNVSGLEVTYTIFLLPFIYLLTNYITKKYNYSKAIVAISVSAIAFVLFTMGIHYALNRTVDYLLICGEFCGYLVSQLVNLYIYIFLLNNTTQPALLIWINYLFSHIVFYMFYTLINLSVLVTDEYWVGYLFTLMIQGVMCIGTTLIDTYIKRGYEE